MTLKPNIKYTVIKGSKCGTLKKGDRVRLLADGCLMCEDGGYGGWLEKADTDEMLRECQFRIDRKWVAEQKKKLIKKLKELDA